MSLKVASRLSAIIFGVAALAGATAAKSDLRNEAAITEGLIAAAIAYEVGERCPTLNARILKGVQFLWSLEAEARSLGYSREEIDTYINSDTEKDRMKALAWQRFAELGGNRDDVASFCAVGQAEIAKGSQVGRLLR